MAEQSEHVTQSRSVKNSLRIGCAVFAVTVLLPVGCHRLGGPFYYTSDPIRAQVIDEETGRPVEGAVVVGLWLLNEIIGRSQADPLYAAESVTDQAGRFLMPAMPRQWRPPLYRLTYDDPWLLVYKPGYKLGRWSNGVAYVPVIIMPGSRMKNRPLPDGRIMQVHGEYSNASRRFCYWNGKQLPLQSAPTVEEQARAFDDTYGIISPYVHRGSLRPPILPRLWQTLSSGHDDLPPEIARRLLSNPRETWRYYVEHKK